ncbi:hypothetical protein [Ornithinimicrobium sediminis]|uniref:hypothetical protein n=1 Tax=Ornithinimicrobium sediminis TaxID=2904603 RepID=UPI001E2E38DC|nr:hypothetical protein [Ornithinimicrobium sediminis]MCE0487811.1 hypothetical protein [Ornithinimicrobium sediminis]
MTQAHPDDRDDKDGTDTDEQEGQVSEAGSGAPDSEAAMGGADSVPDTPDNNPLPPSH